MPKTFGLQWHVTNECDQRCKHCYIWQKHEKDGLKAVPSIDQCKRVVNSFVSFCHEMNVAAHISITGGDPLLYPYFWDLLEIVKEKSIPFTILGNPYHVTPEILIKLKDFGCVAYQMSLDGLEVIHDSLRKPGSFQATLEAIPLLNEAGIRSMIMATVSLLNYKEIPEIARLCVAKEVKNFAFSRYCPTHGDTQYNMSPKLYREFLAGMWHTYRELIGGKTNFPLKDHLWIPFLYEEGLYDLCDENDVVVDGCNCGISHLTLLPNGTVYACRRFESLIGKINEQSFYDIFLSPEMDQYRQINKLSGCKDCKLLQYCRGCHAVSAGTTGNFFDKDPQCWRC
jgi:radical SAM/SPASM domain protein of ACGX system